MDKSFLRNKIIEQIALSNIDFMKFFSEYMLDRAPESFWLAPASSSGKYHPEDERGPGGTALHTARVIRMAVDLAHMDDLSLEDRSDLVVAALLHDMWKGGEGDEPLPHTWKLHQLAPRAYVPPIFDEWAKEHLGPYDRDAGRKRIDRILRAVEAHEGRWSILPSARKDLSYGGHIGRLLHIADYLASRSHITVHV